MTGRLRRGVHAIVLLAAAGAACAAAPRVAFDTSAGRIVVELDPQRAPITCANFLRYVSEGHYDGTLIHRVVEDFVIQGGGLTPDLDERKAHEPIVNEAKSPAQGGLSNVAGTIAMAREEAPDSAAAQWYINIVDNLRLDHVDVPPEGVSIARRGQLVHVTPADAARYDGYAVFGHVVAGEEVVERIRHVPVHTVEHGENFENVPVDAIVIRKAELLQP